ncbi:hypothetical protein HanPSC8_Chr10g0433671 [Helianthus annuus]|nr:hypothetical protein HanPSC8_Chr10g0433671 [Helianthus annuus]
MAVRNLNLGFCFFRFVEFGGGDLKRLERESIRLEREATRREKRRSRTDHGSGRLHQCISAHLQPPPPRLVVIAPTPGNPGRLIIWLRFMV